MHAINALRALIRENLETETGRFLESQDDFDALKFGDRIEVNGEPGVYFNRGEKCLYFQRDSSGMFVPRQNSYGSIGHTLNFTWYKNGVDRKYTVIPHLEAAYFGSPSSQSLPEVKVKFLGDGPAPRGYAKKFFAIKSFIESLIGIMGNTIEMQEDVIRPISAGAPHKIRAKVFREFPELKNLLDNTPKSTLDMLRLREFGSKIPEIEENWNLLQSFTMELRRKDF